MLLVSQHGQEHTIFFSASKTKVLTMYAVLSGMQCLQSSLQLLEHTQSILIPWLYHPPRLHLLKCLLGERLPRSQSATQWKPAWPSQCPWVAHTTLLLWVMAKHINISNDEVTCGL